SCNWGVEGPTDDPAIVELRERMKRNFLASLFLSLGVPMLLGGDEIGRTQGGNNNAYCQDNETSWFDWNLDERRADFLRFTKRIIHLRKTQPVLRRKKFLQGRPIRGDRLKDVYWLKPDGIEMRGEDWGDPSRLVLAVLLPGNQIDAYDPFGLPVVGDTLFIAINGAPTAHTFRLPTIDSHGYWQRILDTAFSTGGPTKTLKKNRYRLKARSLAVFRRDLGRGAPSRPRGKGRHGSA
ncbi:MAG: glycogen debranching enzyme GlgX, partial [Deltaproteobacteria bacterium]